MQQPRMCPPPFGPSLQGPYTRWSLFFQVQRLGNSKCSFPLDCRFSGCWERTTKSDPALKAGRVRSSRPHLRALSFHPCPLTCYHKSQECPGLPLPGLCPQRPTGIQERLCRACSISGAQVLDGTSLADFWIFVNHKAQAQGTGLW